MTPREYIRAVRKDKDKVRAVEFVPPKLGKSGDLGKFVVTFK